jgi:hypothetical protein
MFTDTIGFEMKVAVFKQLVALPGFDKHPSHRETQIQVEKLERMTKKFAKKFPVELIVSLPLKRLNKLRGQERRLVDQQCKVVDRVCMKLMEEMILNAMIVHKAPAKLSKAQLKWAAQKQIEILNRTIHKAFQNQLKESFSAAAGVLGGEKSIEMK